MRIMKQNKAMLAGSACLAAALVLLPASSYAQLDAGADVSIGGGSGVDADVDVSVGGSDGVNADADASVGGGDGVDADVDASVGGGNGVDAEADVSIGGGDGVDADVDASVGGGDGVDADADVSVGGDAGAGSGGGNVDTDALRARVDEMSEREIAQYQDQCEEVLADPARFDADLVALCRIIAEVQ